MASINKHSPTGKGIRTGLQSIGGTLVGLILVVWAVPGVPEAVTGYLADNFLPVLLAVGIPSSLIAYIQNKAEQ